MYSVCVHFYNVLSFTSFIHVNEFFSAYFRPDAGRFHFTVKLDIGLV